MMTSSISLSTNRSLISANQNASLVKLITESIEHTA